MTTSTLDLPPSPPAPGPTAASPRRMIDAVLTAGGLLLTLVFVVAGSLLVWAHRFVNDEISQSVHGESAADG